MITSLNLEKNHSTCLALIDVIDEIYQHIDEHEKVLGIYLDLQKAFDPVDHSILLYKLYTGNSKYCSRLAHRLPAQQKSVCLYQ